MGDQVGIGRAIGRARGRTMARSSSPTVRDEEFWARRPGSVVEPTKPGPSHAPVARPPISRVERGERRVSESYEPLYRVEEPSPAEEFPEQGPAGEAVRGDGSAVGRGGVRGRSRITEGESLLTKPQGCATKQGTYGQKITVQANYFKLETENTTDLRLFQYRVDFSPDEDRTVVRKGLLRLHHPEIGPYIFDGTVMYSTEQLPCPMELISMRQSDQCVITISIRCVGELQKGDHNYIQFFNIIMRKCLDHLKLQLVGRNYFDAKNKVQIKEFRIELWPGYITSIRQCEQDILLCAEVSHKVMRQETVYDMLEDFYMKYGNDYKKHFSKEIMGQIVLTGYNNNTYRIDDVDYSVRPTSTFNLRHGESISYKDYYETKYGITINNNSQPLLVSRSKPKDRRAGQDELVYLVPELCRTTGLTDQMRSHYPTMNALAIHTKMDPKARIARLMAFNKRLLSEPKVVNELNDWGLKLDNKLVSIPARVIPRDRIIMANAVTLTPRAGNWDSELRSNEMLFTTNLKEWVVIITPRMKSEVQDLISGIIKSARGMKFPVSGPRILELKTDRSSCYTEMLETVMSQSNPQLVMCVVPNNNLDRYSAIKKKCCVDRPVLSQVVLTKTIMSKGKPNITAATKIAIQLNCKLGGAGWTVEIPSGNFMVAGFDVCHDKTVKNRGFAALVASLDRHLSRYFSAVSAHTSDEELSNDLGMNMTKAIRQYQKLNGTLPAVIIFYRDGVGEGQIPFVHQTEVQELRRKLALLYGGDMAKVKLAFIIVNKRINSRFFYNGENAPPGTVIDDVVTNPARFDFFLVSQSGGGGTVAPSAYSIISDSSGWGPDKIQRITYKLTQMYYNYSGAVKVPAPCQYAHKLAALVSQAIQRPPSTQLETLLYYL